MTVKFTQPMRQKTARVHHARAAAGNTSAADRAAGVVRDALSGTASVERILVKAAAGAGKSFILKRLVAEAVAHPECARVVVIAFTNKQIRPLAASLGQTLGFGRVCLFVANTQYGNVPDTVRAEATVVTTTADIPRDAAVIICTCHKLGAIGELRRLQNHLGAAHNGRPAFDVLFVDEAWQLPHHLFDKVAKTAPITVGVGDVGQLPPLEVGANPWRGDPGYNPYRAWPTDLDGDPRTWAVELPTVWRPPAGHLNLWRAFYPGWHQLNCVAAPGDRALTSNGLPCATRTIWKQVGTGVPTLLEVAGLPHPEAADVDLPLMGVIESLLDDLFSCGFGLEQAKYDAAGSPTGVRQSSGPGDALGDALVAVLATRNQAVDDATDVVERLRRKHSLTQTDIVASTVDSWQGQTNGITIAIHPLSAATQLDEFNSAFGRLAVACTRATHGLLMLARPGLNRLLAEAPARPGRPYGEPGNRRLPRQTHQHLLATFARGTLTVGTKGPQRRGDVRPS